MEKKNAIGKIVNHNRSEVVIMSDDYDENKMITETGGCIYAYGGDGTLLKAIFNFKNKGKPFFGVGRGSENFLMNTDKAPHQKHKVKKFNLIKVKVIYEKPNMRGNIESAGIECQAFNDIMIGGDMNSWIDFNVKDSDDIIGKFKGGGVIVSTAQGSTGINKNNGGVILPLSSQNWSITGDKTNRKINYVINPKRTVISCKSRTDINLWVDGQNKVITKVRKIIISQGDVVKVIFNEYDEFKRKRSL